MMIICVRECVVSLGKCMYIYVCMCRCMFVCMYIYLCMYKFVGKYACMLCVCVHVYAHVFVCVFMLVFDCVLQQFRTHSRDPDSFGKLRTRYRRFEFVPAMDPIHRRFEDRSMG